MENKTRACHAKRYFRAHAFGKGSDQPKHTRPDPTRVARAFAVCLQLFHNENTPIQIYRKFHLQKLKIFRLKKKTDIFHISAQNMDCGYSLEPPRRGGSNEYPQSMVLSRNKKNNVYPCQPQFYYIKVGFKGWKLYRHVFVMDIADCTIKTLISQCGWRMIIWASLWEKELFGISVETVFLCARPVPYWGHVSFLFGWGFPLACRLREWTAYVLDSDSARMIRLIRAQLFKASLA